MSSIFALAIVGPTAGGKTALSLEVARRLQGEILCADSMQVYREFHIGTAKPTKEEQASVPHHLFDICSLDTCYSAADYGKDALQTATEVAGRGRLPILCGGTGLYLEALRTGRHDHMPDIKNPTYRASLLTLGESEEGRRQLFDELQKVDPESAGKTHRNNLRRVIRALEIYHETGIPKSQWDAESSRFSDAITVLAFLLLYHRRETLYHRIDCRVDAMMEAGLLEEARELYEAGRLTDGSTASQAIGYKEFLPYLSGAASLSDCVEALKTATRRYAKRQLTFFGGLREMHPLYADREDGTLKSTAELYREIRHQIPPDILARYELPDS